MPFSHHSHSGEFCSHADGGLEAMVQTAISKGMTVFALTEHVPRDMQEDLYPEEVEAGKTTFDLFRSFDEYYNKAVRLRGQYSSQIRLLVGLEAEYIRPTSIDIMRNLYSIYKFDFCVGSVHHVNSHPIDLNPSTYAAALASVGGTEEALFSAYFDAQYRMLTELKPAVVGHFDLIRLFSRDPNKDLSQYGADVWQKVVRNISFISSYGGLLELNSASLRKGWSTPYPKEDVCRLALQQGGRFTLSDDAHKVDQVGLNYNRVFQYIQHLGLTHIYYLEKLPMGEIAVDVLEACAVRRMNIQELAAEPFWQL